MSYRFALWLLRACYASLGDHVRRQRRQSVKLFEDAARLEFHAKALEADAQDTANLVSRLAKAAIPGIEPSAD